MSAKSSEPSLFQYVFGFLAVGVAWGFTTPFMRQAAIQHQHTKKVNVPNPTGWWPKRKALTICQATYDLVQRPAYSIPLLLNLSGSLWFFLLVGQADLSLTVPITNSLAFLFTVLGEWYAEGKVISKDTWLGIALVLAGIALCVQSKTAL
ncbi:integral membrane protein [Trichodelitschia bisporula]|uniref:Integral membrane protein n=1 Tax=Trichodelitschia bisporula TaxID=703511 RepID=A0A6G1I696_9PEZI|nr:integral membrane protein [Trichodelitschia bisporula]